MSLAETTRNLCILAHVDHGKSSFADSLLAANGIISQNLAGTLRYLDSREDEQERGITMESSAVSLKWKVPVYTNGTPTGINEFNVNVIDTPGHVDFFAEVWMSSRLCDGALILVDAVEGVCSQTISLLTKAVQNSLRPILVINKMDRLIEELQMSPTEAYQHLSKLVEDVNAIIGNIYAKERMDADERAYEKNEKLENGEFMDDDSNIYFDPADGTVLFASAIDGWAFRVARFAQLYATKLGVNADLLRRYLWGDWYFDPKTKRVVSRKKVLESKRALKPMFVQFILENIWAAYDAIKRRDDSMIQKIITSLNIKVRPQDLKSKDSRNLVLAIFSQWIPLAPATMRTIVDKMPSPVEAQHVRLPEMLHPGEYFSGFWKKESLPEPQTRLEQDAYACKSKGATKLAYISKMLAIEAQHLPENRRKTLSDAEMAQLRAEVTEKMRVGESDEARDDSAQDEQDPVEQESKPEQDVLLGFARLFSGTLNVGDTLYVTLPKYNTNLGPKDPANADHLDIGKVESLYIMMGRDLVPVDKVEAGAVFAVAGFGDIVMRSATLIAPASESEPVTLENPDEQLLVNLSAVDSSYAPIVSVALEPEDPSELPALVRGLKLLSQADPCVETTMQDTGEYLIVAAGEVHLERCIKDLRDRFAKIELSCSEPIVPFRETFIKVPSLPVLPPGQKRGVVTMTASPGIDVELTLRTIPLPAAIVEALRATADDPVVGASEEHDLKYIKNAISETRWSKDWDDEPREPISLGSKTTDANLLFRERSCLFIQSEDGTLQEAPGLEDLVANVEAAFQLSMEHGPLAGEPVVDMGAILKKLVVKGDEEQVAEKWTVIRGSIISMVQDAIEKSLLSWSARLQLAMYSCSIQATADVLGRVYGVVHRRKGRILSEEIREGTTIFNVTSLIPVAESFGFADEIRKKTSGVANPLLLFHGFETFDEDPFWVPTTEEELEDFGELADRENEAKAYVDAIRDRKGLPVERLVVESSEKQKTMKSQ